MASPQGATLRNQVRRDPKAHAQRRAQPCGGGGGGVVGQALTFGSKGTRRADTRSIWHESECQLGAVHVPPSRGRRRGALTGAEGGEPLLPSPAARRRVARAVGHGCRLGTACSCGAAALIGILEVDRAVVGWQNSCEELRVRIDVTMMAFFMAHLAGK